MLVDSTPVARSTESPTELMSSSPVTPCSGLNIATELDAGRFGENINRPAALDIETSLVGDNTDCAWGGRVGTPDFPETILFEDVDPVHHDSIVWGWSMRSNLWPAEDHLRRLRCSILRAAIWT